VLAAKVIQQTMSGAGWESTAVHGSWLQINNRADFPDQYLFGFPGVRASFRGEFPFLNK